VDRDIDRIIHSVKALIPAVEVSQLQVIHPGDDDGLWFFRLSIPRKEVQIESSHGKCPFLIEDDRMKAISDRVISNTVEETVAHIVSFLASEKR